MATGLKLVVLGGGSAYTPELVAGIIRHSDEVKIDRLVLVDVAAGAERVRIIRDLAARMIAAAGATIVVEETLDRRRALDGADLVFSQVRIGGMKARARDESIPLKYGLLGQETIGAGGFANALRTIPHALEIARDIEEICPQAWCLNLTNPAGMITDAMSRYSSVRTLGICNVPFIMQVALARMLETESDHVALEMYGLNHLSFVRRVFLDERDITDVVLSFLKNNALFDHGVPDLPFGGRVIEAIGLIPNVYLRYYWFAREMVRRQREELEAGQGTRGIQVMAIEAELFRRYQAPDLADVPSELARRGGAQYSDVAARVMASLMGGAPRTMVVDALNHGAIDGIPDNAAVEVTCRIDTAGATPEKIGTMDLSVRGLIQHVNAYEQLTVEAAVSGDRNVALAALMANPLVPSVEVAQDLLDDIVDENQSELGREWAR